MVLPLFFPKKRKRHFQHKLPLAKASGTAQVQKFVFLHQLADQNKMDGLLLCARYSFAPNRLKYCGPDKNKELFSYLIENKSDPKLFSILSEFQVLYPYLSFIAHSNGIADPFNERVVEAYWIGNELLETVRMRDLYRHFVDEQKFDKRFDKKSFNLIVGKIPMGARVHHSFHVFNIFKRVGHEEVIHTIESMDSCRIGWGKVVGMKGLSVEVLTKPLVLENGKLQLGSEIKRNLVKAIDGKTDLKFSVGDKISYHWGVVCDKLNEKQVKNLEKYTLFHLRLANRTL